jgi:hypothetical protein
MHLPKEKYFAQLEVIKNERRASVMAAAGVFKENPSGSEGSAYTKVHHWAEDKEPKKKSPPSILKTGRLMFPTTPVMEKDRKPTFVEVRLPLKKTPKSYGGLGRAKTTDQAQSGTMQLDTNMMQTMMDQLAAGVMAKVWAEFDTMNLKKQPPDNVTSSGAQMMAHALLIRHQLRRRRIGML